MRFSLLETIKIIDGVALHLPYHQARLESSLKKMGSSANYELNKIINPPATGIFRCRFVYTQEGFTIQYLPYSYTPINSLKIVTCKDFDYSLKFEEREKLNALFELRGLCDDVLIVTDSLLRDTTKANIALYDGSNWYTPLKPLLFGTTRSRYLDEKKLIEKPLHVRDLPNFEKAAVLNAMVDFCVLKDGIIP